MGMPRCKTESKGENGMIEEPEVKNESFGAAKRPYSKPRIKSSSIKDTFLACGKCGSGPVEMFVCVVFPELS